MVMVRVLLAQRESDRQYQVRIQGWVSLGPPPFGPRCRTFLTWAQSWAPFFACSPILSPPPLKNPAAAPGCAGQLTTIREIHTMLAGVLEISVKCGSLRRDAGDFPWHVGLEHACSGVPRGGAGGGMAPGRKPWRGRRASL